LDEFTGRMLLGHLTNAAKAKAIDHFRTLLTELHVPTSQTNFSGRLCPDHVASGF
jgi:hypothetical protein